MASVFQPMIDQPAAVYAVLRVAAGETFGKQ